MSGRNQPYNNQYTYDPKLYADLSSQRPNHRQQQQQYFNNNNTNYPTTDNYYYHQPPKGPASTSNMSITPRTTVEALPSVISHSTTFNNNNSFFSPAKLNNSGSGIGKNNYNQRHYSSMKDEKIELVDQNNNNDDANNISNNNNGSKNQNSKKKQKPIIRAAGGEVWEDSTLLEWDSNDYRLFCGDLGNEVTDDMLYKAFSKYSSIQKAKVIRDKRTGKSKGYGFVSFKDADEFVKAWKEMNGKYVGNRPIKLRKSNWKDRNFDAKSKKHHPY